MIDIEILENSWFFETIKLNQWEVLFNEWDVDNNLYIVKQWELSIWKFTWAERLEVKELATVWKESILWEWSLSNSDPKEVRISAKVDSIILKIDAWEWFEKFLVKHTRLWVSLLSNIISLANKRLLESNSLVASSYEISKKISEVTEFNNANLFSVIDIFANTINAKYVLYVEKNPIIDEYVNIKYDTRLEWKMISIVTELSPEGLDLESIELEWIKLSESNLIEELKNWNKTIWYLVIWWNSKTFTRWEKKAISSLSVLIAWFIKQKQYFEENMNIEYAKFD